MPFKCYHQSNAVQRIHMYGESEGSECRWNAKANHNRSESISLTFDKFFSDFLVSLIIAALMDRAQRRATMMLGVCRSFSIARDTKALHSALLDSCSCSSFSAAEEKSILFQNQCSPHEK